IHQRTTRNWQFADSNRRDIDRIRKADNNREFETGNRIANSADTQKDRTRTDFVPVALRAYTEKVLKPKSEWGNSIRRLTGWPDFALILDTETTTDAVQR